MEATIGPIEGVPLDILVSFFLECLPDMSRRDPGPRIIDNHPAVVLSHVCRDWRQLALETPRLWSQMYIGIHIDSNNTVSGYQEYARWEDPVRAWVSRSAECPLALILDIYDSFFYGHPSKACSPLVGAIIPSSKRWQTFDLKLEHCQDARSLGLTDIFSFPSHHFRFLRSISIILCGEDAVDLAGTPGSLLPDIIASGMFETQNLRRVKLGGWWRLESRQFLAQRLKQWAPLTELEIAANVSGERLFFDSSQALQFLQALPCLTRASFFLQEASSSAPSVEHQTTLILPNLIHLTLHGGPIPIHFTRALTLPSLNALSLLQFEEGTDGMDGRSTVEFLQKFSKQLVQVAVNPLALSTENLMDCLEMVDGVEWLSLILHDFPKVHDLRSLLQGARSLFKGREMAFASGVLPHLANSALFPNLKHLELHIMNPIGCGHCDLGVVDLISSRRRMVKEIDAMDEHYQGKGVGGGDQRNDAGGAPWKGSARSTGVGGPRNPFMTCLLDIHVSFYGEEKVNIIEELDNRGVDLDIDPFNIRLNYLGSSSSLGELSERPWGALYL